MNPTGRPGSSAGPAGHRSDLSRWRSGPERLRPVNRVRAGRQQLSAELARCLRAPGRHLEGPGREWPTSPGSRHGPPDGDQVGGYHRRVAYQSLYRRYRSRRFGELVGQRARRHRAAQRRAGGPDRRTPTCSPGPRGTGKTSVARILAKALNCTDLHDGEPCGRCESCLAIDAGRSYDLHELDAASNNGVEAMRDLIEQGRHRLARALEGLHPRRGPHAVDGGVERAAEDARGAAGPRDVRAGHHRSAEGAAHDPQPLPALRVRADPGGGARGPRAPGRGRCGPELDLDDEAVAYVVRRGAGSARDTLSVLEQVAALGGVAGRRRAARRAARGARRARQRRPRPVRGGPAAWPAAASPAWSPSSCSPACATPSWRRWAPTSAACPTPRLAEAGRVGRALGPAGVTRALEALGEAIVEMRQAPDARVPLEVALIRLTRPELDTDVAALLERVARLERRLAAPGVGRVGAARRRRRAAGAGPCGRGRQRRPARAAAPSRPGATGAAAEAGAASRPATHLARPRHSEPPAGTAPSRSPPPPAPPPEPSRPPPTRPPSPDADAGSRRRPRRLPEAGRCRRSRSWPSPGATRSSRRSPQRRRPASAPAGSSTW